MACALQIDHHRLSSRLFLTHHNSEITISCAGSALYDKGMARVDDLIAAFDSDMADGTLPQVSWIVGPANVSEHATWWPSAGEDFTARILKVLAQHPDVYGKMAFILDYDEGGQFFDHAWTPTPPVQQPEYGISTVTTKGEVTALNLPIGLGFRVPLLVISPWSRGKGVVSEVFDHTSVVRFVEERFNVTCPNISPWRRVVAGNLMSAFNFSSYDASWPSDLPDTSKYVQQASEECSTLPAPEIPAKQNFPTQEPGTRFSRALPYQFLVSDTVNSTNVTIIINNVGTAGSAFMSYDIYNQKAVSPRQYAAEPATSIIAAQPLQAATGSAYAFALHGPNGFLRSFIGDVAAGQGFGMHVSAAVTYIVSSPGAGFVRITMSNDGSSPSTANFTITDNVYNISGSPWFYTVKPGASQILDMNMSTVGHWYDFTVTALPAAAAKPTLHLTATQQHLASASAPRSLASASSSPSIPPLAGVMFERRMMGRMETGVDTISDPAMALGLPGFAHEFGARVGHFAAANARASVPTTSDLAAMQHPDLPERFRKFERKGGDHKDAVWHWPEELKEEL